LGKMRGIIGIKNLVLIPQIAKPLISRKPIG